MLIELDDGDVWVSFVFTRRKMLSKSHIDPDQAGREFSEDTFYDLVVYIFPLGWISDQTNNSIGYPFRDT